MDAVDEQDGGVLSASVEYQTFQTMYRALHSAVQSDLSEVANAVFLDKLISHNIKVKAEDDRQASVLLDSLLRRIETEPEVFDRLVDTLESVGPTFEHLAKHMREVKAQVQEEEERKNIPEILNETPHEKLKRLTKKKKELEEEIHTEERDDFWAQRLDAVDEQDGGVLSASVEYQTFQTMYRALHSAVQSDLSEVANAVFLDKLISHNIKVKAEDDRQASVLLDSLLRRIETEPEVFDRLVDTLESVGPTFEHLAKHMREVKAQVQEEEERKNIPEILNETPHEKLKRLTKKKKELEEEIRTEERDDFWAQRLATTIIQLKQCQEEIKKSKEMFSEAVKAGSVSVNMINTLIQGEAGVGKTSTKCILFNEPPPHFRTSTSLAEAPVQIRVDCPISQDALSHTRPRDVQVLGVKVESAGSTWNRLDGKELERIVVEAIATINNTSDTDIQRHSVSSPHPRQGPTDSSAVINTSQTDNRSPPEETRTNTSTVTVFHTIHADNGTNTSERVIEPTSESELQAAVASIYGKIVDLVKEKQISPCNTNANEILGSNWIYFIDSGGQPHFHNLLPHFVHGISVALFVHRLSSKLEEYPIVEYFERNQAIGEAYRSSLTTEDTLKCLVRSMQSHTINDEKPILVFIGTFLDKIGQSSETLAEKNEKLLKLLTTEFYDQLIFCQKALRSLIYPLNAKNPGAHEERMAKDIRSVVESSPSRIVTIPIWWYVLEITLKKLSAHFDRMVLSKQECLEVALQLDISEKELVEALKLFHQQHIFHYYPEIVPDIVFTSPQLLLDKLTELVREVYSMKRSHSDFSSFDAPKCGKWRIFRDQGILILEFLKEFDKHYVDNLFTPPDLLRIFMRHLIITPLSSEGLHKEVDFTSNSIQYYMPCLLDMLSLTKLDSHRNHSSVACPLLIRFPNGWPRAGVFCCLQVYLMQLLHWTLVLNKGKPKLIAQNCVMLSPPNSTCRVTLIDSFSYFEVHVEAESDVCQKMCPMILSQVLTGIDASCRTLRYNNDRPHLAFFCPCASATTSSPSAAGDPSQHHAAELFKEEGSLRCTIDHSVTHKVDSSHCVWLEGLTLLPSKKRASDLEDLLQKTGLASTDIDQELNDDHILDIYPNLEKWERVSAHLGLRQADITAIKQDAANDTELMRLYALRKWKSMSVLTGTHTFRVLLKALLKCGCTELALEVCELLK